jgi:hypothetical protein
MVAASVITVMGLGSGPAPASEKRFAIENSPDVLRPRLEKEYFKPEPVPFDPAADPAAVSPPTQADVGDAESFGKPVLYMGLAQSQAVVVLDDCSASDPAIERCIPNAAAPAITSFHETNLATINLPAKASKTLLCFKLTPFINVSWANNTGTRQTARFNAAAEVTIESPVLADPALIDPTTNLPFGGSLTLRLNTWNNVHSIDPGEFEQESSVQSRGCIGGIISRRSLVENYGLSTTQANGVFKKPMTIRLGARGSVSMSQSTLFFYGLRLYGD